ncbi:hypothetical protein LIER_31047 [Lithospermum erythrorhizon]|uniref:Uncharacterized protein n=1 Tax=Lithospermum erythrorhizon TaxID=34254 RepID=A0AAV3RV11_LITER
MNIGVCKKPLGLFLSRKVVCLFLFLLLSKFQLKVSSHATNFNEKRLNREKLSPKTLSGKAEEGTNGNQSIFDDEKRKVYSGPNPLHNR